MSDLKIPALLQLPQFDSEDISYADTERIDSSWVYPKVRPYDLLKKEAEVEPVQRPHELRISTCSIPTYVQNTDSVSCQSPKLTPGASAVKQLQGFIENDLFSDNFNSDDRNIEVIQLSLPSPNGSSRQSSIWKPLRMRIKEDEQEEDDLSFLINGKGFLVDDIDAEDYAADEAIILGLPSPDQSSQQGSFVIPVKIPIEEDKKQEDDLGAFCYDRVDSENLMLKPELQRPKSYIPNNSSQTDNVLLDMEYLPAEQEEQEKQWPAIEPLKITSTGFKSDFPITSSYSPEPEYKPPSYSFLPGSSGRSRRSSMSSISLSLFREHLKTIKSPNEILHQGGIHVQKKGIKTH